MTLTQNDPRGTRERQQESANEGPKVTDQRDERPETITAALTTPLPDSNGVEVSAPAPRRFPGPAWIGHIAPLALATVYLILGYIHYAPGAALRTSAETYRSWAFPSFKYSDLTWLYLRDHLSTHPKPYLDYQLEYPPLTGLLSYLLSFAPSPEANFALTYLVLGLAGLGTVLALHRVRGASAWYYAALPALFFYTGYQWDPAAVLVTALSLVAYSRGRDRLGTIGMTAAVWFKLFPIVWVAAAFIDRVREKRYRAAAEIAVIFGSISAIINVPLAVADWTGWSFFFKWNGNRPADSGIWVFLRNLSTHQATQLSFLLVAFGALGLTLIALASRRPVLLPLGAMVLLWWLLVNKTFTTHLVLWVFLALAVLRPPLLLWSAFVAVDIAAFQLGNYLNVPIVPDFRGTLLIPLGWRYLYDPLQLVRSGLLLLTIAWGIDRYLVDGALGRSLRGLMRGEWRRSASEPVSAAARLPVRTGTLTIPKEASLATEDQPGVPERRRRFSSGSSLPLLGTAVLAMALLIPTAVLAVGLSRHERVRDINFAQTMASRSRQPSFDATLPTDKTSTGVEVRPAVTVHWSVTGKENERYVTKVPVILPPGTYTVTINGTDAGKVTVANGQPAAGETGPRPNLRGTIPPGQSQVEISLSPPVFLSWQVTGETPGTTFRSTVPVALDPGSYNLYVGGLLRRRFVITDDATS